MPALQLPAHLQEATCAGEGQGKRRRDPPRREVLVEALETNRWRIGDTSRALAISRSTLWRWMRELRLDRAA